MRALTHLEEDEEVVQPLLIGTMVKVLAARVQEGAHKANPEIRMGRVQLSCRAIRVPTKREERVQSMEDHVGLDQLVNVQLPQKLDSTDPSLAKFGPVEFHPYPDVLKDAVHHVYHTLLLLRGEAG